MNNRPSGTQREFYGLIEDKGAHPIMVIRGAVDADGQKIEHVAYGVETLLVDGQAVRHKLGAHPGGFRRAEQFRKRPIQERLAPGHRGHGVAKHRGLLDDARGDLRGEFVTGVGRGIRIAVQAAQIASPRRVDLKDPCGSGQVHVSALAPSPR